MSDTERRSILTQVAEGTLSPDEAAERLSDLGRDGDHQGETPPRSAAGGERGLPPGAPATSLRVTGSVRMIEIIGDPSVAEAVAEGPHDARREGSVLIIEGEGPDVNWSQQGWRHFYSSTMQGGSSASARSRGPVFVGLGQKGRMPTLKVRVNPDLPIEVGVKAGAMSVKGVNSPITAECDAGSLQIKGFSGPLQIAVNAGKVEATGRITTGASRIEANAAKVDLRLDASSSVRIHAKSELGRVVLPGADLLSGKASLLGHQSDATVGAGEATLDLEVNVGAATVSVVEA